MKSQAENPASLKHYLRDKLFVIVLAFGMLGVLVLFLLALKSNFIFVFLIIIFWLSFLIMILTWDYLRRHKFYQDLLGNLENLDQAYLILETLESPTFYDGEILHQVLYRINKSMIENVRNYQSASREFQDYVEMWIHEVKTPLATLSLIAREPKVLAQVKRLDDYVEQILYFARAENAERDYLIQKVCLAKPVDKVANRNLEIIRAKQIDFVVKDLHQEVYTDSKWLEFIINQILNNSIKYGSTKIELSAKVIGGQVTLSITDDGCGIDAKDLPRVFDKSFTGENGRIGNKSTGMGLYIAKILCDKLGHQITIASQKDQYTSVKITFTKPEYYKVLES